MFGGKDCQKLKKIIYLGVNMEDGFRKKIERQLSTSSSGFELCNEISEQLKAHGIAVRRGWVRSQLLPAVNGVLERTLGDNRLSGLYVCELLENSFRLGLVEKGVFKNDDLLLDYLNKSPSPQPRFQMRR